MAPTDDNKDLLLEKWCWRCVELQYVHYTAGNIYARLNYFLGVPVVALSAAAGTTVFVSLEAKTSQAALIITGVVSMSVAVLAGIQTFLRFSERAEQHRTTAARYGVIKRSIEQMRAIGATATDTEADQFLDSTRKELDALATDAPGVSGSIYRKAMSNMRAAEGE